jgi:hypothetical protein
MRSFYTGLFMELDDTDDAIMLCYISWWLKTLLCAVHELGFQASSSVEDFEPSL